VVKSQFAEAVRRQGEGRLEQAIQLYTAVLRQAPHLALAWGNLGVALRALGKQGAAVACLRRAVALQEDPGMFSNLGNALRATGDLDASVAAHERALALDPERGQSLYNMALAVRDRDDCARALDLFDRAIVHGYTKPEVYWDRALTNLTAGNFAPGFADYHTRWQLPESPPFHTDIPDWDGGDLDGKSLFVYAEQGFGDTIQFARYLPRLKEKGGRIFFEVQPELTRLMAASGVTDGVTLTERGAPLPAVDVKVALMTLPHIFGTTLETVPGETPYLGPPADAKAARLVLPRLPGIRLTGALAWAGRPTHKNDRNRSLALEVLSPLLELADIRFVSVQKGAPAKAIGALGLQALLADGDPVLGDFADTAVLLSQCDLVISVDTAVAHLAGALGRPVWVLLPAVADWRWLLHRTDNPWYPSMRLYRQAHNSGWDAVIAAVRDDLAGYGKTQAN
jgi:hypothetical protein